MEKRVLKTVKLEEEVIFYLQKLSYELDGYRVLLRSILSNKYFKYNEELYQVFMKDYQEVNMEYNLAMNELKENYGKELPNVMIDVDFSTYELKFIG